MSQVVLPAVERWLAKGSGLADVIAELLHVTVEQHLNIAWSRLAADVKRDVALLVADGERWYFRKQFENGRLGSRLRQAVGWLRQLELIDDNGITNSGELILQRGQQTLEALQGRSR